MYVIIYSHIFLNTLLVSNIQNLQKITANKLNWFTLSTSSIQKMCLHRSTTERNTRFR